MKTSIALLPYIALVSASPVPTEADNDTRGLLGLVGIGKSKCNTYGHPFEFTSTYSIHAKPGAVVDSNNEFTGGLEGCSGTFNYGINTHEDIICYNITVVGFRGEYDSPAVTATHIHEAAKCQSGPPRIAFPNPEDNGKGLRTSVGCIKGPFKTGVVTDGVDSGDGFQLAQIEENPGMFFTDTHSSLAVPGAIRGQLSHK